jgi:hypothetical protein
MNELPLFITENILNENENLYSRNIIRGDQIKETRWAGHVVVTGETKASRGGGGNTIIGLKIMACGCVNYIQLGIRMI